MSNLPGNPHEDDAMQYSAEASMIQAWPTAERPILAQQATTHATLALAYEQRTANLIAYVEKIDDQTLMKERCTEIAHRLGLMTYREIGGRAEK